uniref:Histone acetyltransferase n=1 Tax=Panagrolaimus sp. ES5 TaxID=591445 RepID=A0AC34GPU8_9BILA
MSSRFSRRYQNENSPSGRQIKKPYKTEKFFERDVTPDSSFTEQSTSKSPTFIRENVIKRLSNLAENQEASGSNTKANEILIKLKTRQEYDIKSGDDDETDSDIEIKPVKAANKSSSRLGASLKRKNPKPLPISKSKAYKRPKKSSPKKSSRKSQGNSPVKTRSNIWEAGKLSNLAHCLICEQSNDPFIRCRLCENRFHAECIQITSPFLQPKNSWRCFDCLWCAECKTYISDHSNVQCNRCGRAYHGRCKPPGTVSWYPFKFWRCGDCLRSSKTDEELEFFRYRQIARKLKPVAAKDKKVKIVLLSKKKFADHGINHIRRLTVKKLELPLEDNQNIIILPDNVDEKLKKDVKQREFAVKKVNEKLVEGMSKLALKLAENPMKEREIEAKELTKKYSQILVNNKEDEPFILPYQEIWPDKNFDKDEEKKYYQQVTKKPSKSPIKKLSSSQAKYPNSKVGESRLNKSPLPNYGKQMYSYLSQFEFKNALERYVKAKRNALDIAEAENEILDEWTSQLHYDETVSQFLHFGPKYIIPVKKRVPACDSSIKNAPLVFVCQKCFELTLSPSKFCIHMNICKYSHPPGNEIYRDDLLKPNGKNVTISFFEVHGIKDMDYCSRMCIVATGLLPAKAVTREVDLFTFYILTEFDDDAGFVPVGFFSKELKPSFNNNLSCLLVFNQYRSSGYGKLLVDVSYELSKREDKFGSPEHPLSNDGLHLYRSYWIAKIFGYLRQHRNDRKISFDEISKETYIHVDDIVSTLLFCRMIKQGESQKYVVDCCKAWFSDLRLLRRQAINPAKLIWQPKITPGEEHKKYYVCSSDEDEK